MPVLRVGGREPRPRHPQEQGRPPHVGERGRGLSALEHTQGGPAAPCGRGGPALHTGRPPAPGAVAGPVRWGRRGVGHLPRLPPFRSGPVYGVSLGGPRAPHQGIHWNRRTVPAGTTPRSAASPTGG